MEKVLIFAGTKEGRILAEHMCQFVREVHVSVATEYGEEVLPQHKQLFIRKGRLSESQMEALLKEKDWEAVIDATHPYAVEVSVNIKKACEVVGRNYLRLLRKASSGEEIGCKTFYANTKEDAVAYLNSQKGNILLTTGSKELGDYIRLIHDKSRVFARILADAKTVEACRNMGLKGHQIICMQGPFDALLNEAMLRQINAKFLVTKDTGKEGGFLQKLEGAKKANATVVIIKRPTEEEGYSMQVLLQELGLPPLKQNKQTISIIGIGMGNLESMTIEAYQACLQADVIVGAKRMVEALESFHKPSFIMYQPNEILEFLKSNKDYKNIVVVFSGDIGFYSGAKKLLEFIDTEAYEVHFVCGISSVVYMASKLKMSWQDMKLISVHGRMQNLIDAVRTHEKVFSLIGKKESVCELARDLVVYGMETVIMHVGYQLSYPEESVFTGNPTDFTEYDKDGLSVVVLENPDAVQQVVTHGISDDVFVRGEAPMTKEEIRSISLSKLALTKYAVVYDIGAGTGSVGIECALQIPQGMVYAIEKKEKALELLKENKRKLQVANLEIVTGSAPMVLEDLPIPTHAFIGGSSGNMEEIIEVLLSKNPNIRIVVNAIAMETVAEVMEQVKKKNFTVADIVSVSVGKSKVLGNYHMMMGQNPVYIFTLQK